MRQVWTSNHEGVIGGVPFRFTTDYAEKTSPAEIIALKPKVFVDRYRDMFPAPKRIVELGIFEGGSAILFADMYPDAEIVAIDWLQDGNPAIAQHIERLGLSDRVHLHWGVSQDDAEALPRILREAFGDETIDLVIDDASHQYGFTTRAFDILYPRLAKGGHYVIEDWGWAHWPGYTVPEPLASDDKPLSAMIVELVLATASLPGKHFMKQIRGAQAIVEKLDDLPPFSEIVHTNQPFRWTGYERQPY
ncbi:O-methyltransferase [Phenylobacterium deserti]|uniref:Class I SAM-dependent methyltransferase n=1 Tax=Phenylobacterium deserti TaxID=1914756 RepID=A0A328AFF0_9CAUL|nr:class I SAM-dependent methyltransferase [Phenylobacterium deserti]RAK52144.1 hypothetical protein DJ018_13390 [Phenylobacterium deserti]